MSTTPITYDTSSRVKRNYDQYGIPVRWREIDHPDLKEAVRAFHAGEPLKPHELALLIDTCDYHVQAPWLIRRDLSGAMPTLGDMMLLGQLRSRIKGVKTVEELMSWLLDARRLRNRTFAPLGEIADDVCSGQEDARSDRE